MLCKHLCIDVWVSTAIPANQPYMRSSPEETTVQTAWVTFIGDTAKEKNNQYSKKVWYFVLSRIPSEFLAGKNEETCQYPRIKWQSARDGARGPEPRPGRCGEARSCWKPALQSRRASAHGQELTRWPCLETNQAGGEPARKEKGPLIFKMSP